MMVIVQFHTLLHRLIHQTETLPECIGNHVTFMRDILLFIITVVYQTDNRFDCTFIGGATHLRLVGTSIVWWVNFICSDSVISSI